LDKAENLNKIMRRAFGQRLKIIKYTDEKVWTKAENLDKY
jgi:hypothetical protein